MAEFSYRMVRISLVDLRSIKIPSSMMRNYIVKPNYSPDQGKCNIEAIYTTYRRECTYWLMQKFGIGREDAIDVFQNTVIILHDKIENQKLDLPADKIKSYLYGIARNKGLEYLRSIDRYITTNYTQRLVDAATTIAEKQIIEHKIDAISKGMNMLNESSKKIISLYYEKNMSISEITTIMGYKNNETTKNMKYKSLQKLKKVVKARFVTHSHEHIEETLYAL